MINKVYSRCIAPTRAPKYISDDFTVIIYASRHYERMKSYGPVPLFNLAGRTLLEEQITTIGKLNSKLEIILVTGFETDKIIRKLPKNIRVVENTRYYETNECEDIRLALNATITNAALIIDGNLIFNSYMINQLTGKSNLIVDSQGQIDKNEVGVTIVDNKPTILSYGLPIKWCHAMYLTDKDLKLLRYKCKNRDKGNKFLFEILNEILDMQHSIGVLEPRHMNVSLIVNSRTLKGENSHKQ